MESELRHLSDPHGEQGTGMRTRVPIVAPAEPGGEGRPGPRRLTGGRVYCADMRHVTKATRGQTATNGPPMADTGKRPMNPNGATFFQSTGRRSSHVRDHER